MTIKIQSTSTKELRDQRKKYTNKIVRGYFGTNIEEGTDQLVTLDKVAELISGFRSALRDTDGEATKIAESVFSDNERDELQAIEDELYKKTDMTSAPKRGDVEAVRAAMRAIQMNAYKSRKPNPAFDHPEYGNARFVESLWGDVPKLKSPKASGATEPVIAWLAELLG